MDTIAIHPAHPINAFKTAELSPALKNALNSEGDPAEQIIEGLEKSEVLILDIEALQSNWENLNRAFSQDQKTALLSLLKNLFNQPNRGGRMKPELIDLSITVALSIQDLQVREQELLMIFNEMLEVYDNTSIRGRIQEALKGTGSTVKIKV